MGGSERFLDKEMGNHGILDMIGIGRIMLFIFGTGRKQQTFVLLQNTECTPILLNLIKALVVMICPVFGQHTLEEIRTTWRFSRGDRLE